MPILISVSLFASVYLIVATGSEAFAIWLRRFIARSEATYKQRLSELFMSDWSAKTITYLTITALAIVFLLAFWISGSVVMSALIAALVIYAPGMLFRYLKEKRMEKLEAQLTDALELLADAVKSGQSLIQSIESVSVHMAAPVSQEFGLMVKEYNLGVPLDQVIRNARDRIKSKNLALATSALIVSREKGGNLSQTLRTISDAIREIHRLEEKIKTSTAEGRKSARTMSMMPFLLGFMLYFMDPAGFSLLFVDPLGNLILFISLVLIGIAFFWARKIVNQPI